MKIRAVYSLLCILTVVVTGQAVFGMELTPAHTISVKPVYSVASVAFDKKNEYQVNLLLSCLNNDYLTTYNSRTTQTSQYNYPLGKKSKERTLFARHNAKPLPKKIGSYLLNYKNNAVEIWSLLNKSHLYTLSHEVPLAKVIANDSKTQMITVSTNNVVNVWQLKDPIIFTCGKDRISIAHTEENMNILKQSTVMAGFFGDLGSFNCNDPIALYNIKNDQEFDRLFALMKLVYKNYKTIIETTISKLSIDQLCSLVHQISFYDVVSKDIRLVDIICKAIAEKYNRAESLSCVKSLPFDLQNVVANYRVNDIINYIDCTTKPERSFVVSKGVVYITSVSSDEKFIATSSFGDGKVRITDLQTGGKCCTFSGHTNLVSSMTFSPYDKHILATGSGDNTVMIWDIQKKEHKMTLKGHTGTICAVIFDSQNSNVLLTGSCDGSIKRWDIQTGACIQTFDTGSKNVCSVVFNPKNPNIVALGFVNRALTVWNMETNQLLHKFNPAEDLVPLTFSDYGNNLVTTAKDKIVKLWNLETGLCKELHGHTSFIVAAEFMPNDPTILITVSDDMAINVWNVQTQKCLSTFIHDRGVVSAKLSRDGKSLIAGYSSSEINTWSLDYLVKLALVNELTIDQADWLEEVHEKLDEGKSFESIMNDSWISNTFSTFALEVQKYLHQQFSNPY